MKHLFRSPNFINTIWNLLDVVIFPVVFLAITPFFIHELGELEFGLWMLINSVLASFQLVNFGLGAATQRNVARFRGQYNLEEINASINTNLSLAFLLLLICLILGIALYFSVHTLNLFNLDKMIQGKAATLMLMASFLVGLKFIEQIFQHALKGYENFKVASRLSLSVRFAALAGNVGLVFYGYGLYAMVSWQILISFIFLFVHLVVVQWIIKSYHFSLKWDKTRIFEELAYGLHTWIQSMAVIATYQMDRFIVTGFFGLAALSYYSIVATMFNHIHMSINALVPWMLPKVARLREKGSDVIQLFLSARSFVIITGISVLLIFYALHVPIFTLWLGESIYLELAEYVRLFIIFELFFIFTSAPYFFLNANGNEKLMTQITLISSAITLFCMFTGIVFFHSVQGMIYGLIAGTIIGITIENSLINTHILHRFMLKESILILIPSFIASMLVYGLSPLFTILGLVSLPIVGYLLFIRSGEFNLKVLLFG